MVDNMMVRSDDIYFHYIISHNDDNNKAQVQIELGGTRHQIQYGGQLYTNKMY